ncbi:NUDIX domain-containing protein [Actinocorallia sp. API 0066]|uniref:NUDIX domain-containing protein n=1 Tax=Actinocorallia sp. API 0066 TaxID=2896846 RepID=UPI001E2BD6A4|nr:NUDIX domain-containing protein [Actinocorallia sp. API 0066]MCD0450002.1 NUDIX domain-containing protein [Actinocorallia sp. API 0066]
MTDICDNASTGVIVADAAGRLVLLTRAQPPAGIAPAAGHVFDDHAVLRPDGTVDEDTSFRAAAVAEVEEELGLTVAVADLEEVTRGWRISPCRRPLLPGREPGHAWRVYRAPATGLLTPSPTETRGARWYTPAEVQSLADRTAAFACGDVSEAAFDASPGLQPVWVRWLVDAALVTVSAAALTAIDALLHHQAHTCR